MFRLPDKSSCWICESPANSKEHKIKASDLRRQFGATPLVIGNDRTTMRNAQGIKSKQLKFLSSICEICNSTRTQPADRAYDTFIQQAENWLKQEASSENPTHICHPVTTTEMNVCRYFAKLLGCHLSEMNAPIPTRISEFVAGSNDDNCIAISVQRDPTFQRLSVEIPTLRYAAHGGVVIITKKPDFRPIRIHSTQTIGPLQIIYEYTYTDAEVEYLLLAHPEFCGLCRDRAMQGPDITAQKLRELGFNSN